MLRKVVLVFEAVHGFEASTGVCLRGVDVPRVAVGLGQFKRTPRERVVKPRRLSEIVRRLQVLDGLPRVLGSNACDEGWAAPGPAIFIGPRALEPHGEHRTGSPPPMQREEGASFSL